MNLKSSSKASKINTKKKALKLIYDPVTLLKLLYSKYGDIEEDYNLLYINQLIFETSSHYNIIFKEFDYFYNYDEYLKRWYKLIESVKRMPKINDYYKNYHKFFCKPCFSDFNIANIMQNYSDEKAELYYKDNFGESDTEKDEDNDKKSNTLSSLDNDTTNKIIFNDKNKFVIEKNEKSINYSMTMSMNSSTINSMNRDKNKNLISDRNANDSFENIVHDLIFYKKQKNKNRNNKKNNKNNKNNSHKNNNNKHLINNYINNNDNSKNEKTNKINNISQKSKNNKMEQNHYISKNYHSNNIVKIKQFIGDNNIFKSIIKVFNTPQNIIQGHSQKTNFGENNSNKNIIIHHQRNKTSTLNNNFNYNNNNNKMISSQTKTSKSHNKVPNNLILTFKDLIEKQNPVPKNKNKTIDSMSFLNNKNIISSNIKLYDKINSNKNMTNNPRKNGNYVGSKFNLVKNVKNLRFDKTKSSKQTSYNYYQNILNQKIPKKEGYKSLGQNNNNINNNTYNASYSQNKNNSISPINSIKDKKIYNNVYKNKLTKNQINNYNINFNNVFLTSSKPNTYIIDNKNSTNTNLYNSINNNINNNNFIYSNILEHENKQNKNLYVMNLKNLYNISRNKNNILINNNPLTQTEGHHSKIQNNYNIIHVQKNNYNINKLKNAKFVINKTNDSNYGLNNNINNNKSKSQYKNKSKKKIKDNQKISNEINNFIKKTQINFYMRNKNKKLEIYKTNKLLNTGESEDMIKKPLKNNKSFNCLKNGFSSSSISRKKNKGRISKNIGYKGQSENQNNDKISSLTSQKKLKSKYKRKIK